MGFSRNDPDDWNRYSTKTSTKKVNEIFTARGMKDEFDPLNIKMRESRDSDANPASTAIIIGADETGSIGKVLAESIIRKQIGVTFEEIIKRNSIPDPHLMVMGVGDVLSDKAPLQVTQFESDSVTLAEQLEGIYIEGNGGSNDTESYNLPWYFAAEKTAIDCLEKRGKKGYLFTLGDEEAPRDLTRGQIKKILGDNIQQEVISNRSLLAMVERKFHTFHIVVEEGYHIRHSRDKVYETWRELLGQRVVSLVDHTHLAEVIISIIEINEGKNRADVIGSWDGTTSLVVAAATEDMSLVKTTRDRELVKL